jgi:hypothetical protein
MRTLKDLWLKFKTQLEAHHWRKGTLKFQAKKNNKLKFKKKRKIAYS